MDRLRTEIGHARHCPWIAEARVLRAPEQFARFERRIKLREGHDLARRYAAGEVLQRELAWMAEAGGRRQLDQRLHGGSVEIRDPLQLVRHHQGALAAAVLSCHAGRATVGSAAVELDAAEREHEAAGGIAPVSAERHRARDIEGRNDLAARSDSDAVAGTDPDQRVVDEGQPVAKRHPEMVEKLERRRPGATLLAVDDDEVWIVPGFQHGLADGKEFPGMADAQLEAGRLATGPAPQLGNEADELERSGERRVARRRNAILSHRDPAGPCDLGAHLRGRQHAAMTRLGALTTFHFDHFDLVAGGGLGKCVGAEDAVAVAASEIARADFPDDIAAHLAVIRTEPAL